MTLTLLEFIGCCFGKSELWDGKLHRWAVYESPQAAETQANALVSEAIALLGAPQEMTADEGVHRCVWPTLWILNRGLAVGVYVPVRLGAYCKMMDTPSEVWRRADDDVGAILEHAKRITL